MEKVSNSLWVLHEKKLTIWNKVNNTINFRALTDILRKLDKTKIKFGAKISLDLAWVAKAPLVLILNVDSVFINLCGAPRLAERVMVCCTLVVGFFAHCERKNTGFVDLGAVISKRGPGASDGPSHAGEYRKKSNKAKLTFHVEDQTSFGTSLWNKETMNLRCCQKSPHLCSRDQLFNFLFRTEKLIDATFLTYSCNID